MWSCYDWVYCLPSVNTIRGRRFLPSVNTICGRVMIGLSLSSISKHNMCRIIIGLSLLSSVSKHNMRSHYDWVVVVFCQ